ncbi:MAG: hypothetical protein HOO06_07745 [Bdellovibrionaceae bacterium]|jgi:hypothetical protein|nr:hypothetical protein [Pseudobdellovibrionaceae bacterium]
MNKNLITPFFLLLLWQIDAGANQCTVLFKQVSIIQSEKWPQDFFLRLSDHEKMAQLFHKTPIEPPDIQSSMRTKMHMLKVPINNYFGYYIKDFYVFAYYPSNSGLRQYVAIEGTKGVLAEDLLIGRLYLGLPRDVFYDQKVEEVDEAFSNMFIESNPPN